MTMEKKTRQTKSDRATSVKVNKELILKSITDPRFRKELESNPEKALGVKQLSDIQKRELDLVVASIKGIETQMDHIADRLLCVCAVSSDNTGLG